MVQLQVQLDRSLGPAEARPIEGRKAQLDHRRIEAPQRILESEFPAFSGGFQPAPVQQRFENLLVHRPGPMLVGVGQGRTRRRFLHPQVHEFAERRHQPAANLAQRVRSAHLAEQHRHKLVPAGEALRPFLRLVPAHRALEIRPIHQREHLRKATGSLYHGLAPVSSRPAARQRRCDDFEPSPSYSEPEFCLTHRLKRKTDFGQECLAFSNLRCRLCRAS
jgi:hypothetical protein